MKKRRVLILMIAALWLAGRARAQEFPVATRVLGNGMKVMVQPDHSIPNVALYVFYRIGSRNECPGTTGISHFFEHMMFNGARKYGPGELDRAMEANGASNNAYTERDVTVYQDWFPRPALELIFDIEADRIQNLSFSPQMIESERQVVASERRMRIDADNFGLLDEQLWATGFIAHPYQWPVLGWTSDIEHWTIDDLKKQFVTGYSPANATLVVVGDVSPEEVFSLAGKYLEPIPAHAPPPPVTTTEPKQLGERRLVVHKVAELPLLMIGYHVPPTNSKDHYALEVLRTILSWGESSRLYQRLVDKDQTTLDVETDLGLALDPTLLVITAQPKQDADPRNVEQAIYQEIEKIQDGGVSDAELQKAKNIELAGFYRQVQTINARASAIGDYDIFFGDYHKLFEAAKDYAAVTKEDVQAAARAYLIERNRTVATLLPESQEKGKP